MSLPFKWWLFSGEFTFCGTPDFVTHGQQLLGICLEGCLHKLIAFYNPTMMMMVMTMNE
jgi:hypothetical protein